MATTYTLNLTLPTATVSDLQSSHMSLFAMRSTMVSQKPNINSKVPIWMAYESISDKMTPQWVPTWGLYALTHQTGLATGSTITVPDGNHHAPLNLGQVLDVSDSAGTGTVDTNPGNPGTLEIQNQSISEISCGMTVSLRQKTDLDTGGFGPSFIMDCPGGRLFGMQPTERVLFFFAPNSLFKPGDVVERGPSQAALIDFSANSTREAGFNSDTGAWFISAATETDVIVAPAIKYTDLLLTYSPTIADNLAERMNLIHKQ